MTYCLAYFVFKGWREAMNFQQMMLQQKYFVFKVKNRNRFTFLQASPKLYSTIQASTTQRKPPLKHNTQRLTVSVCREGEARERSLPWQKGFDSWDHTQFLRSVCRGEMLGVGGGGLAHHSLVIFQTSLPESVSHKTYPTLTLNRSLVPASPPPKF